MRRAPKPRRLCLAVSGSGGLVGSALVRSLEHGGHRVVRLVRSESAAGRDEVRWDPASRTIDAEGLRGLDGVVHLAGENIAAKRWSSRQKDRIRRSRVDGTRLIAETLAGLDQPPKLLVNASAIGFYGDRGEEILDEESPSGSGFLADSCVAWEAATEPARQARIRVALLRIGVVLSSEGGALRKMLPAFKLGLGGRLGHGRQFMSWVALDDLVRAVEYVLHNPTLAGPINVVAPRAVRNREFTRVLGRVLRRPTVFPVPAPLLRLALGQMADELLLSSARITPARLHAAGFSFRWGDLEAALRSQLGRASRGAA